jgi:hypothetical protein
MLKISIKNPYAPALAFTTTIGQGTGQFQRSADMVSSVDKLVRDLKGVLSANYEGNPKVDEQRLICRGRLLGNEERLIDVCGQVGQLKDCPVVTKIVFPEG